MAAIDTPNKRGSNYDKYPSVKVQGITWNGWGIISGQLQKSLTGDCPILVLDTYAGVDEDELMEAFRAWQGFEIIRTSSLFRSEAEIRMLTEEYVTEDELFGYLSPLDIGDYFNPESISAARKRLRERSTGMIVLGCGADYVEPNSDLLIYADIARWELQQRFRGKTAHNLGIDNTCESPARKYKRGYFNDWPILDKHKRAIFEKVDYWIDANQAGNPLMIDSGTFMRGIEKTAESPFRVKPFFDPAPWGGQWMKSVCGLDKNKKNYGWCFDCVPEENSLLLDVNGSLFEMPAQNLIYLKPIEVLGEANKARFGESFPIRFDFLDTIGGGNLSLQVHPTNEYIRRTFGIKYTQDESYYILDAEPDAHVYLGTKDGTDGKEMIDELYKAQGSETGFDVEKFVNKFPASKHDHFLIPGGTIHCSGSGALVLEISATPNIFTFKLWDWGRLGLDGKPRPINIGHAAHVIQWNRETEYVRENLVNQITKVGEGEGWTEERTGLHESEFIETRRHWFTGPVKHDTKGGVNVLNLIEGDSAVIESPSSAFDPFIVHYAETFIIPAGIGEYIIRPLVSGQRCGTIKAYVRNQSEKDVQ